MQPKSELGNMYPSAEITGIAQRKRILGAMLTELDTSFEKREPETNTPLIAHRLATARYSVLKEKNMIDLFPGGTVSATHASEPYDIFASPDHPGMAIVSRCLQVQVTPRKGFVLFSRKKASKAPPITYYLFAQQADALDNHLQKSTTQPEPEDLTQTGPERACESGELVVNKQHFAQLPQADDYKFGIVRRGGTLSCFTIVDNPGYNTMEVAKNNDLTSGHAEIFQPDVAMIDRCPERIVARDLTPELCGDLLKDIRLIIDAQLVPETLKRRWYLLWLGRTAVKKSAK